MRKRALLPVMLLAAHAAVFCQLSKEDAEREKRLLQQAVQLAADTTKPVGWHHAVVTGANFTQVSFTNWAQGGENALAYAVFLKGSSIFEGASFSWSNSYRFAFGQTRLGSQGLRKTDDEIYYEALLVRNIGTHLNPYASATFRTQFAKGYTYDNNGGRTPVSMFMDPAYFTQSIGMGLRPIPQLTTRLGLAVREIFTSRFRRYANDPAHPDARKIAVNGGLQAVTETSWNFAENLGLNSRMEIFSPLEKLSRLYVRSDNLVTAKVNKFVSTSVGVQLLHDLNASPRTQIKEVFALGLTYQLL